MELEVSKRPTLSIVMVQRVLLYERQMRFSCWECQGLKALRMHVLEIGPFKCYHEV